MTEIASAEVYKLYWFDDARTIIVLEIHPKWTWADAWAATSMIDKALGEVTHDVYTVYHFHEGAIDFPSGLSSINVRKMLEIDVSNEKLIIFVNPSFQKLQSLLEFIGSMCRATQWKTKFRYIASFDEALKLIEADKAAST
jgi:hypothetical protein